MADGGGEGKNQKKRVRRRPEKGMCVNDSWSLRVSVVVIKSSVGEDVSTPASKRKKLDVHSHTDDSEVISEDESPTSNEERKKGRFKNFPISKASRKTLKSRGITHLFPIQYLTYDHVYNGKDVIAQARKCVTAPRSHQSLPSLI